AGPEQAAGDDQVDHQGQVDQEEQHPGDGDPVGQVVDLVGQPERGDDHREVLAPALLQPQPDALDDLQQRVEQDAARDQLDRVLAEGQRAVDQPDDLGVVDVVAELPEQRPQGRVVLVEGP